MHRLHHAALVATILGLTAMSATPVAAARPDREFVGGPSSSDFAAGEVCPFDLRLDTTLDHDYAITFAPTADGTQRIIVTGHVLITATNLGSGAARSFNVSGPGTFVFAADGSIRASFRGRNALYLFPTDVGGPGLWLTTGLIQETIDAGGNVIGVAMPPHSVDLCAALD